MIESLSQSNVPVEQISAYIEQFSGEYEEYNLAKHLKDVNHCFSALSISEMMSRLEEYPKDSWVGGVLRTLKKMSPTAVVTTISLLRRGKTKTFKNCLKMEYTLAKAFLDRVPDLKEGIIGKLVHKSKAVTWNPSSFEAVDTSFINGLFEENRRNGDQLNFSNDIDFEQYPHRDTTLPTVEEIRQIVQLNRNVSKPEIVIEEICRARHNKVGLRQKLESVMSEHVVTREVMEKEGRTAVNSLNWRD